ncbi:inositol monophosphatase [Alisedimentitalea sp. MJ-SS2]|uniref:inositol monophosphatase family protein n=1 Tax=Aliisedimentitalea sp. MJ-SS2 TaxID=3049795 RepID=UPI00291001AC|nr:inositol monophosphatase [Alisedimentitalea sp. MJ-SS2]MDU8928950.1 inositol monophosphatase [Alisedimentitalea sp. MJ-SS2]
MPSDNLPMPATRLTPAQEKSLVQIVRRAARAEISPRFRKLTAGQISTKSGPQDIVTAADTGAEAMIARAILRLFPNAVVLGEEAFAGDASLRDTAAQAELAFIVDPLDGTWNFAHGVPLFGIILAATRFGKPIFGLIYDPQTDDWMFASEDGHALQSEIGVPAKRLFTSDGGALETLSGFVHLSLMPQDEQEVLAPLLTAFDRTNALRCSAHEYRLMAAGAVDFVLSGTLNPWDHAAGVLITRRAGGVSRFVDGRDYDISVKDGHLLTACDEDTWNAVRDTLAPALAET